MMSGTNAVREIDGFGNRRNSVKTAHSTTPAVLGALCFTLCSCGVMLSLAVEPRGSAVRPMGHAVLVFLFAALSLAMSLPACLMDLVATTGRRRMLAALGVVLSLAPLPAGTFTLLAVAAARSLTLQE